MEGTTSRTLRENCVTGRDFGSDQAASRITRRTYLRGWTGKLMKRKTKLRWSAVPTVPSTEQMHRNARFRVRQLGKSLAQLGYIGADATNVDIWDLVCYFREQNKVFGLRMRTYTKPVEKKMKILMKSEAKEMAGFFTHFCWV